MPDINDFFQDLLRPFNNCTDSAKKSLLVVYDEANKDGIMDEDEVPPIQEINSFSPTSIESALTDKSLKDDIDEHNANHNGLSLFVGDKYVCEDDVDLLMLAPESLEEYEQLIHEEKEGRREERKLRKALIEEELNIIIKATEEKDELDGHEIEPEAIEALGIAANRVAYQKKYFDVAKCEYVYVPSVAYTIMNGSLLEEAAKHYFGKSDEFVLSYALGLGSAVVEQSLKKKLFLTDGRNAVVEDVDLRDDDSNDDNVDSEGYNTGHSQLAKLVFGVSPRAGPEVYDKGFESVKHRSLATSKSCGVAILFLLFAGFQFFLQKHPEFNFIPQEYSDLVSERYEHATQFARSEIENLHSEIASTASDVSMLLTDFLQESQQYFESTSKSVTGFFASSEIEKPHPEIASTSSDISMALTDYFENTSKNIVEFSNLLSEQCDYAAEFARSKKSEIASTASDVSVVVTNFLQESFVTTSKDNAFALFFDTQTETAKQNSEDSTLKKKKWRAPIVANLLYY